ncbi:MAG: ATP-binding protein [Oscillospiraceae bacterium]|nr:ATP-binding protein [Oscillospiraceae bacterium]
MFNIFVGRKRELASLNERYAGDNFEFMCIYGRRRVGKTELIKEFIKDKKAIFFTGLEDTSEANLMEFSEAVLETTRGIRASLESYNLLFDEVYNAAKNERLVLVIDEYPYLAKRYEGISSLLQREIDHRLKDTKLFLILCGSSMSFMENQVMGHKSPLYGRRSGQLKLLPFDYYDSAEFYKGFTREEKAIVYGITGGIPKYLMLFSDKAPLKTNIIKNFFSADSVLFEEPSNLLKQEVNEAAIYNAILTSIATGSSELNKIAAKTHVESSQCVYYIKSLIELGIIKREVPFGDKETSKKTIYRLNDGMFRFWYRFVYRNNSQLQMGRGEEIYNQIQTQIFDFMGEAFEAICCSYMWRQNIQGSLPFPFANIGRWWGNNPKLKSEQEIDLIAADFDEQKAIFCECKWTNEKVSESVVDKLIDRAEMFSYAEKYYYIFSKSGFTEAALAKASLKVRLIELKAMI